LLEAGESERVQDRHLDFFLRLAEEVEVPPTRLENQESLARLQAEYDNLRGASRWSLSDADAGLRLRLAGALGWFWWWRGQLSEGRQWLEQALVRPATSLSDATESHDAARAKALFWAGWLAWSHGDDVRAVTLTEQSLELNRTLGDRVGEAFSLLS